MSYETEHIAEEIKTSRELKGLSQRQLSAKSGVPQAQISRFERGAVDLRLSSLIALARALDIELQLVPRKAVPAIMSIVRSTAQPETIDPEQFKTARRNLEQYWQTMQTTSPYPTQQLDELKSNLRFLEKFRIPKQESKVVVDIIKHIEKLKEQEFSTKKVAELSRRIQNLRNHLVHLPSESNPERLPKPAYSLDEEDEDA